MNAVLARVQQVLGSSDGNFKALAAPVLIVMVLAMMVLPLPAFALDVFFTFNIAAALMVMLVSAYMIRPLDFAAFPTVAVGATTCSPRIGAREQRHGMPAAQRLHDDGERDVLPRGARQVGPDGVCVVPGSRRVRQPPRSV